MKLRFPPLLLLCAAAVLWAVSARAAEPPVRWAHAPVGEVRAGEQFELEWSCADRDVEEIEVLLSVDGGRHYGLRVTPELDAQRGRWTWRIPAIANRHARLRLRYGTERQEAFGEETPEFTIAEDGAALARETRAPVHESGWWSDADLDAPAPRPNASLDSGATLTDGDDGPGVAPPRSDRIAPPAARPDPSRPPALLAPATSPLRHAAALPRFLPLRE